MRRPKERTSSGTRTAAKAKKTKDATTAALPLSWLTDPLLPLSEISPPSKVNQPNATKNTTRIEDPRRSAVLEGGEATTLAILGENMRLKRW